MSSQEPMKIVYTIVERGPGKSFWTRVGVGFVNRDGSMNLKLDAIPVNGTLQVRDWEERDGAQKPTGSSAGPTTMSRTRPQTELGTGNGSSARGSNTAGGLA
jgi:hypothetical protein